MEIEGNPQQQAQIVIQNKLTCYLQRPQDGSRYIVKKNLDSLVDIILKEVNLFNKTDEQKYKILCQLQNVIFLSENTIKQKLEVILRNLQKYLFFEDINIQQKVRQISQLLGLYSTCDIFFPILMKLINELDQSSIKSLNALNIIFGCLLKFQESQQIENQLEYIIKYIQRCEENYNDNQEVMTGLFQLVSSIVQISSHEQVIVYIRQLFSALLTIQSVSVNNQEFQQKILEIMEILAHKGGYSNITELHANEVSILLNEFKEKQSYAKWHKYSSERYKFEVIIRNCKEGIAKYLDIVFEIISVVTNPQNDYELRMDMLVLCEFILNQKELVPYLKQYSTFIMSRILIPCTVWKVGKPNIKIRKAGIINIINLIQNDIIDAQRLHQCLKELIPIIKTCLSDDWGPDLRFATCKMVEKILLTINDTITEDELRDIYPLLIERLDDAQDIIRIEITKAISAFFSCQNIKLAPSTFEYLIKAIFIHLDDQNEEIQLAVYNCLRFAVRVNPKKVQEEAQINQNKMKYPRKCQELLKFSEEMLESQK